MRKRRRNLTIIHNEIDYDKLAEAIVRANREEKESFSPSREWMKFIMIPIFWIIAVLSGLFSIGMGVVLFQNASAVFASGNSKELSAFILECVMMLFSAGFCVFSIVAAKEIDKEKDKAYIAAMFSNIVAMAALIVALVALIKG